MEDSGVCTYRPTMKYNCLLDKPDAGRQKNPLCKLPTSSFTYGSPSGIPAGSVKEALCNWPDSRLLVKKGGKEDCPKNDQISYRRIKLNKVPDFTFGKSSSETEDMKALMCHGYRERLLQKMKAEEAARRQKIIKKEERLASRRLVMIPLHVNTKEIKESLWKMSRFSKVQPKVSTWREPVKNTKDSRETKL
ncbi:uncharacterized protein LOC118181138 [Stegodyphus dumicola]|uniref:uncharacterized protein LOC118181138 n=1 Tax=Stegodyphus dumicola TaxID=202533 RepID=UPI0015AE8984|nr:uncharacterized protein LOC118181138 [Stegodyphus dumicola]